MSGSPLLTPGEFMHIDPKKVYLKYLKLIGRVREVKETEGGIIIIVEDMENPEIICEIVAYNEVLYMVDTEEIKREEFIIAYGIARWWGEKKYLVARWIRVIGKDGVEYYLKRRLLSKA